MSAPAEPTVVAGRYELVRRIAAGGMAVVHEARHRWTHRHVALKIMSPQDSRDAGLRARFLREARTAARLTHPNVVAVLDMGEAEDGSLFIIYELLVGQSLAALREERGSMSAHEAFAMLSPVMEALSHAHELGIVHRDVKPANIVLAEAPGSSRVPKLVDFGVAKELQSATLNRLTQSGMVVGTPYYMSPEQISGDVTLDGRADVWSMAVTLYEVTAGRRPFDGAGVPQLLGSILDGAPTPLHEAVPGTPASLHEVLMRCFRTDRDERVGSMRELQQAIRAALWTGGATPGGLLRRRPDAREDDEGDGLETEIDAPFDVQELTDAGPEMDGPGPEQAADAEATVRGRIPGKLRASYRVGILVMQTRAETADVVAAFESALDAQVQLSRYMHYAEIVDALAEQDIDLAWLPPVAYVRGRQQGAAELLLSIERSGDLHYACALVGRKGVVDSYEDVPGRDAVWVDAWSAAGYLMPRAMLRAKGIEPDRSLASQGFLGSYPAALEALAMGRADVTAAHCGVDEFGVIVRAAWNEVHPVTVLDVSEPIPGDTICVRPALEGRHRAHIARRLGDRRRARTLLRLVGATRMVRGDTARYDGLLTALDADSPSAR